MTDKKYIIDFLERLQQNNAKEWMDEHRDDYEMMKACWLSEVEAIVERLSTHNPDFKWVEPKKTIQRINNNRKFHPEKPTYKNFVSCVPGGKKSKISRLYVHIGLEESFIGGGLWHPNKENLEKMRGAIDYEGEKLEAIIENPGFKSFFGGLNEDPQKLKTSPQNYSKDHRFLDLLNRKNFVATKTLNHRDFFREDFIDIVEETYRVFRPLDQFILKALSI